MNFFKRFGFFFLMIFSTPLWAQHQELDEAPNIWGDKSRQADDTTALLDVFRAGTLNGHFRYFAMATDNSGQLTDWYANAAGGGIRFETAKFHGFQFAVSGFYIFNIASSNLDLPDSLTNARNRYEVALFDVENPAVNKNLDRLEEFYLKYSFKKSDVAFGKQLINTPFINLQDGRMRPTAVHGLYFHVNDLKRTKIQGGLLTGMAPRGTVRQMGIGESIGAYPVGVNTDGSRSGYANNIESDYIGMLGITHRPTKNLVVQLWDVFVDNLMNTFLVQADFEKEDQKTSFLGGVQLIRQNAVNQGGHTEEALRFFTQDASLTYGARVGYRSYQWEWTANYNRITGEGRYLMPREWGRDPFYTFMPRERNEGFGDVHALMGKMGYQKKQLKSAVGVGYFQMPDVQRFDMNKYGMPSYLQANIEMRYAFGGFWKGLEAHFLLASKFNAGETYGNLRNVINKVDMFQYNLVMNYRF